MLTTMLGRRQNTELLVLSLLFLMKLAIFKENLPALRAKPPKAEKGELPALLVALTPFVPHNQEPLLATALGFHAWSEPAGGGGALRCGAVLGGRASFSSACAAWRRSPTAATRSFSSSSMAR